MKLLPIVLALSFLSPATGGFAEGPSSLPAPSELVRLDQVLDRALVEKEQGRLKPDRFDVFLVQFRASLNQAWDLSRHTPIDTSVYARIQSKLGDASQALATLETALKKDPQNVDLLLARGEVSYRNKNYAAALAEADALLEREPANKRALALKHFSEGRTGSSGEDPAPARLGSFESTSTLSDPSVVSAGQRAQARQNALHFVAQAKSRLKMDDAREALRYAVLAEVSDPILPDAPMLQGLSYMSLKEPGSAMARFARAEELWQAAGDKQADLARTMKQRAGEMSIGPKESTNHGTPASDPRRNSWPLEGAGAGFLITSLGSLFLKRDEEDRWRKPLVASVLVGAGVLGGAFLGSAAFIALAGEGGTLALAGGGAVSVASVSEGATVASVVGGVAGGAASVAATVDVESEPNRQRPTGLPPIPLPLTGATDSSTSYDEPQRQAEYERAKDFCNSPPPETGAECSDLSKKIDHANKCIELYKAWDARWQPGRHKDNRLAEWNNRLRRYKGEHKRKCAQR